MTKLEEITASLSDLERWRAIRDSITRRNTFKPGSAGRALENCTLNEAIRLLTDYGNIVRQADELLKQQQQPTPLPTCAERLRHAHVWIDTALDTLRNAQPVCCTGVEALLLLDLIDRAVTMQERIRETIKRVKEKGVSNGNS